MHSNSSVIQYDVSVFQYVINIIKLWPDGQITDYLHLKKKQQNIKSITYLQNN